MICYYYALFARSMHRGFLACKFTELFTFQLKLCLVHFVVCPCHALFACSMHCGNLAGEFSELFTIQMNYHALHILWSVFSMLFLVAPMHWWLLACEFIKLFTFQLNCHLLFILCFVFAMVFLLASMHCMWIFRRWAQKIVYCSSETILPCSLFDMSSSRLCLFQCTVAH